MSKRFPAGGAEKIEAKTGIANRHIAAKGELASDLAVKAAEKLFARGTRRRDEIDFLLFCTQSPDYPLPTTACLLQERLGLPRTIGDFGFQSRLLRLYLWALAGKGPHRDGRVPQCLAPDRRNLQQAYRAGRLQRPNHLRRPRGHADSGGCRPSRRGPGVDRPICLRDRRPRREIADRARGSLRAGLETGPADVPASLYMDGPGIFSFTLRVVPSSIRDLLEKASLTLDDVDLFVFHQANAFMLEHLRKKLEIPREKFVYALRDIGNTVSATIPIALREAAKEGKLLAGMRVMLVGFGVGYSWGSAIVRWREPAPLPPN